VIGGSNLDRVIDESPTDDALSAENHRSVIVALLLLAFIGAMWLHYMDGWTGTMEFNVDLSDWRKLEGSCYEHGHHWPARMHDGKVECSHAGMRRKVAR